MNSCYNYGGCGCNNYMSSFPFNPFGCGGCQGGWNYGNAGFGGGNGCTWFAIVLVVFLLLIICGCTKIC